MTNECTNRNRRGDCLDRNSRQLCEYCDGLLSDDERTQRQIAFIVSALARKTQKKLAQLGRMPRHCLTLRPNEDRTCIERGLYGLCAFCVSSMTEQELIAYVTKIEERRNEIDEYWQAEKEAKEYAASLGVDLDHCYTDLDDFDSYHAYTSFHFSKPCFIHK